MKKSFYTLLLLFLLALPKVSFAQNPDIIGITTIEEVREEHSIFDLYIKRYSPDEEAVKYLSAIQDTVQIYVLFGTWCHDSKKQVPAFAKTIEAAKNPNLIVEYIAVSKKKTDPDNLAEKWGLKLTPTFIIYREGDEVGRIIEEPIEKLEQDMVKILKSES